MSPRRERRRRDRSHAARVAVVATLVVVALYVVGAEVINVLVAHRLTNEVDVRLVDRLEHLRAVPAPVSGPSPTLPQPSAADIDDAPSFLWAVTDAGVVTPLTAGAPALPTQQWSSVPVTVDVGSVPFRFIARRLDGRWVVVGQSVSEISRVHSAFLVPEIVFGVVLLVAVFAGAFVIGLRASAPLELIRRRQVEFTADASHELRTPLSVIEAEVGLALRAERDPANDAAVLQRIAGEGRRLRQVVDDLLWLARNDGSAPDRDPGAACDLGTVATDCAARFLAVSEARGLTLDVGMSGRGPFLVPAAAEDIDRLTGVLVDNACRYAGPGGRVEVRVRALANRVSLEVDDSGTGIPEDEIPYIFDRFHRANESPGGTGLGLAIADTVVRSSRGSWTVGRSRLGGAHMAVSWRRGVSWRAGASPPEGRAAERPERQPGWTRAADDTPVRP